MKKQPIYERISLLRWRYHPRVRPATSIFDVVPIADIALLIVLFFIISSPMLLQPGIAIQIPEAPFRAGAPFNSMVVTLSQENMVFFDDERSTLRGLASAFAQARHQYPDRTVVIEADGRISHELIVEIYNMAMQAGIRDVTLATRAPGRIEAGP